MKLENMLPNKINEAFELLNFCATCDNDFQIVHNPILINNKKFKDGIFILESILIDNKEFKEYIKFFVSTERYKRAVELVKLYSERKK